MHRNRRWIATTALSIVVMAVNCYAFPAHAQQSPVSLQQPDATFSSTPANIQEPKAQESTPPDQDSDTKGKADPKTGTSNDRLFYTLPNFLSVSSKPLPPLTAGQKFKTVTRSAFDYAEYVWYGALAGISQAENSEPGYGQGASGYGKRYGAAFADGTIENYMTQAVLPSLLRQDPRFYQSGKGSFWHRAGYAVTRILVTKGDSGHQQFNASEIFGSAISAGISTYSYHPHADRNFGNAASVWGSELGYDTITIVVKEFWPDIKRKLSHKHREPDSAP